jgi:large subunit ribosomal protein L15
MTMPIRLRPQPKQPAWTVNDDDEKLNQVYDQLLTGLGGPSVRGRHVLDEQVKVCVTDTTRDASVSVQLHADSNITQWVAITHKSFSHGRLGFNDRLAYLGKRILDLQTSLALLNSPPNPAAITPPARHVFQHPALSTLSNITPTIKESTLNRLRLSTVAMQYGLEHVVRWKPKKSDDLKLSGIDAVLAQALYAIVGAVALQKGGKQADRLARTRILAPLGLR